ncbi:sulfite exporter TauE/SafE family protein [Halalkalibacter flavus]|uniref:sulfite exporter TauE/SafE family protein n=1 Tax=Halalkalibacter flavus TaxID=3090668 RepID=UPI002FCB6ABA
MEDISLDILTFLIFAGFAAAFIDSVVGGGGLISIPALLFTGLPPSVALGTNKLAATMGSLTSTINFLRSGKINKRLVVKLLPLSIIGSGIGVYVVQLIPPEFLKPIILVLLVLVTIYTLLKKDWGMESTFKKLSLKTTIFIVLATLILGFYDGFLGAGTGSFLIFAFLLLGFDFVESAGNAKVLNFGSNLAALITFILFNSVNFYYGIPMGIAMVLGAFVGSRVAIKSGAAYVKLLFIAITVVLIGKSIWDYIQKQI